MRPTTRTLICTLTLVLAPTLAAFSCESPVGKPPKRGEIITITPGSAACYDEQTDVGARRSVAVKYVPDGTDRDEKPWPETFACVTPEKAKTYKIGGRYP